MKIVFASNNWADAHQQMRLRALADLNFPIVCFGVTRDYYPSDSTFSPIWLGNMKHGRYINRLLLYFRFLKQLFSRVNTGDLLYVYGFDLIFIAVLFRFVRIGKIHLVYEICDIRELFFSHKLAGRLLRRIETMAVSYIDLFVVTSPAFVEQYFRQWRKIHIPNFLLIENKIHSAYFLVPSLPKSKTQTGKVRIGYFGVLRCAYSLNFLLALAETGKFEIILRGIFMPATQHFERIINDKPNITYLGHYQSPNDLARNYAEIDIVWAVYPHATAERGNHRLARTNRFYESLFFKKPAIVQKGTADATEAEKLGNIALEIDLNCFATSMHYLLSSVNRPFLDTIISSLQQVPSENYLTTNEYKRLESWIQQHN